MLMKATKISINKTFYTLIMALLAVSAAASLAIAIKADDSRDLVLGLLAFGFFALIAVHVTVLRLMPGRKLGLWISLGVMVYTAVFMSAMMRMPRKSIERLARFAKSCQREDFRSEWLRFTRHTKGDINYFRFATFQTDDGNGSSVLHLAAAAGCSDIVEFLVKDEGIRPTHSEKLGGTPLMSALGSHSTATAKTLLENGARTMLDCNWQNEDEISPITVSAMHGDLEMVKVMEPYYHSCPVIEKTISLLLFRDRKSQLVASYLISRSDKISVGLRLLVEQLADKGKVDREMVAAVRRK